MNTPNTSWKSTIKVLWFGESNDQSQGALPAIAVNYPNPGGSSRNLLISSAHAVLGRFSSNLTVTIGTFAGLDKSTGWLPNDHPCGGVRNTVYPITKYDDFNDLFVGTLCRDLPPEAVCEPAPPSKPGDKVEWWSVARRMWVFSTVLDVDALGRVICEGAFAISQDSGSPAFTPDGKFIGAVSAYVDEYNGRPIFGCLIVTAMTQPDPDPAIPQPVPQPPITTPIPPTTQQTTIPRTPIPGTMVAHDDCLFVQAIPDNSIWMLTSDNKWRRVSDLPPLIK